MYIEDFELTDNHKVKILFVNDDVEEILTLKIDIKELNKLHQFIDMNKKLFHIEFKNAPENEKHFYYGDLTILCNTHENIGISKFTLDRWNFENPFENEICVIRKSELVLSTRLRK